MTSYKVFRDDGVYIGPLNLEGANGLAQAVDGLGPYQMVAMDDFQSPTRVYVKFKSATPEPHSVPSAL